MKNLLIIFLILIAGCSILQPKPPLNFQPPKPGNQIWETVKKSDWLVTVSIIGIAIGTFAFINGSKIGLPAIASCCVSLFMTLAVARYAVWMAVCGLIGSILACGVSILLRKRALIEVIKGVQKFKDDAKTNHLKSTLTPYNNIVDVLKEYLQKQSKPTQKLVQQIKADLKLRGEI